MNEQLLPCPFCGSKAQVCGYEDGGGLYVTCTSPSCFCSLGEMWDRDAMPEHAFKNQSEAIAAWNRRAQVERQAPEGFAIVPLEPEPERIESMCMRYDHGHGFRMTIVQDGFREETVAEMTRRQEANRTTMRQLYEEATGQGFYRSAAPTGKGPEDTSVQGREG